MYSQYCCSVASVIRVPRNNPAFVFQSIKQEARSRLNNVNMHKINIYLLNIYL